MDKKKSNKKKKFYKESADPDYYTHSIKGFIVTSDQNREKNAVKDAYNFLNQQIDLHYQRRIEKAVDDYLETQKKVKTSENSEKPEGVSKDDTNLDQPPAEKIMHQKLEDELQHYQKNTRPFFNTDTNCRGVIFIKVNSLFQEIIDVKKIANSVIKQMRESNIPVSRFCHKLIPIEVAAKADFDLFKEYITPMIKKKFQTNQPKKWVLHFKCRNNNKFSMKPFLEYILEIIGKEHSVDYKNPDYTIFVEINNQLMCLSILKKFSAFKGYSLQIDGGLKKKADGQLQENKSEIPKEPSSNTKITQDLEFEEIENKEIDKPENIPEDDDSEGSVEIL